MSDREFLIRVSYLEIYNEEINDLLAPDDQKLQIHESLERGIFVAGLREEIVNSAEQVLKLIEAGEVNRHFGETNMNAQSSRSHTIFRMVIESKGKDITSTGDYISVDAIRVSVLVKDQTYFLSHLSQDQLKRLLFPLGRISKDEVRRLATNFDLPNKERKDSQGICFLGKGVMMNHRNVLAVVSAVMMIVPGLGSKDVYLAYLPLAHILELAAENVVVAVGGSIGYGSPLTLTDTSNKVKRGTKGDASQLGPTVMTAVPAILDRVRDGVRKKVDAKGGLAKRLFDFAFGRRLSAMNGV